MTTKAFFSKISKERDEKMKNSVVIKGNKYGIVLSIKEDALIEDVKTEVAEKIKEASKFFKNAQSAISFEGKKIDDDEKQQLIDIICENSDLDIVCVVDNENEEKFKNAIENANLPKAEISTEAMVANITGGQFYRGTLRSGQVLESDSSIVILGDVNPGAKIVSGGNVVVLGSIKGTVYAGLSGDPRAFVVSLDMHPVQIRIGDVIARSGDKPRKNSKQETKIAYVEDGNIYIEPFSKEVLNDIKL